MSAAGKEWQRWGDKANRLMDFRQEIILANDAIDCATRADDPVHGSIFVTQGLRHLRKAIRDLEMLRYLLEEVRT